MSLLGYGILSSQDVWTLPITWGPFAFLFGFIGWLVSRMNSGRVRYRPSAIARLRVLLPSLGLAMSIFGVAVAFTCDPTSCRIHPFRLAGIVMSAIGLFVFLAGLTLAAAFPPDGTIVG